MTPNFRVQVRNTGEAWRTVSKYSGLESAEREARRLAGQRSSLGDHSCPVFCYVRVVCGDQAMLTINAMREVA